jgi:hypothetical protein
MLAASLPQNAQIEPQMEWIFDDLKSTSDQPNLGETFAHHIL